MLLCSAKKNMKVGASRAIPIQQCCLTDSVLFGFGDVRANRRAINRRKNSKELLS